MKNTLENLNIAPRLMAISMITPLVECSDWVVYTVVDKRPFESYVELASVLVETILTANKQQHLELFRGHPELAGSEALEGRMTKASNSEQGRLGLLDLEPDDLLLLLQLNAEYRSRFGYPFIIALHRVSDLKALFFTFKRRLNGTALEEYTNTLAEIASVIEARTARAYGSEVEENRL